MRVVKVWPDKELEEMWTPDRVNPLRKEERECYLISPSDGQEAEFCSQGNIKVMIFSYEITLNKYINIPSKEDLELFYRYSTQLYAYIPLIFNAKLL